MCFEVSRDGSKFYDIHINISKLECISLTICAALLRVNMKFPGSFPCSIFTLHFSKNEKTAAKFQPAYLIEILNPITRAVSTYLYACLLQYLYIVIIALIANHFFYNY